MAVTERRPDARVYLAFIALAVLSGIYGQVAGAMLVPVDHQFLAAFGLPSLLAGIGLVAWAAAHGHTIGGARHWRALLLLQIPQWCGVLLSSLAKPIPWLYRLGWGTALLLAVAAPLWLALLAGIGVARVQVPRIVVAATVVATGAICLVVPVGALTIGWPQLPMLVLQILLSVITVLSWALARPALERVSTELAAGCYLLLNALGYVLFAVVFEQSPWRLIDWRALAAPLLANALLLTVMWWLWFWLFQRIALPAFGMRALAAWSAGLLPGFLMFGFMEWRMDAAVVISLIAIGLALRAKPEEEQPVLLGLSDS